MIELNIMLNRSIRIGGTFFKDSNKFSFDVLTKTKQMKRCIDCIRKTIHAMSKKIIAFSGSSSSKSINQQLIHIVSKYVQNAEVEILSLLDFVAPMFSEDEEALNGASDSMKLLHAKMVEADGFIVSSPEHNGSMPAVFKNTIDWQSRLRRKIFNDKPVVFLATSPGGRGGASVLAHLLAIMPHQGANVVGGHGLASFYDKVSDGELAEGEDKTAIQALVAKLEEQL